jgi:DNA transformation protein and related proteins
MGAPKGQMLFVNLGASQARRRLKGFGHGVRQVQSAGRNRATIIHTATGKHLHALEAQFADVGFSHTETGLGEPIDNLPNLGPTSAAWLRDAGLQTIADLERLGPVAAYKLARQKHPEATLNLLWALEAGLLGKDARELSDADKNRLRSELERKKPLNHKSTDHPE